MGSVIRSVILAFAIGAVSLFAAGTITQTSVICVNAQPGAACSPINGVYAVTVTFVADAADGSVPTLNLARTGPVLQNTDGLYIYEIDTDPGSPAPTDNWDITMVNSRGLDLMGGGCLNRDTSNSERCFAASANPPLNGNTTITITGNSVNSATGVLVVYLAVNGALRASAGGVGSITEIDQGTGITVSDGTGPIVTVALDTPVTVPNGGTGDTTLTAHGVLLGEGTSAVAATSAGTAGQCLTSNGASADPSFQACAVLGNAVTRVDGTTVTVSASDASGFATGTGPASFTTLATFTIDTRTITAIADIGGSPKQTRITFGTAWPTTTLAIAEVLAIGSAAGTGCSGLNNLFTIQDRSDTTHADIIYDSTGCTYTASSATAGQNAAATGTVWFSGDDTGTVQAQVPSSTGLILTSTGGPTTINQTQSPTYSGSPFGTVDIVAGAFSGTATNARTAQRAWPVYAGNSGITVNPSSSGTTISTTADVMSKSGTNAVTGIIDLTLGAAFSPPGSNTLPATCGVGQLYIKRNATATVQLYVCTSTDTWTAQGGASGVITGTQFVGTQGTLAGSSTPVFTSTATWNNAATAFTHIFANITNTASAAGSLLMDLQIGGASKINVTKAGVLTTAGYIQSGTSFIAGSGTYTYLGQGGYYASADGVFGMFNNNQNDFGRLCIGPCTSSFPALKRSTTVIQARLADDSNFATFQGNFTSTDGSSGVTGATCSSFKNGLCVAP